MGHEVTLGGDRLGAGKRNKISLKEYERSTHDLSYVWRSTMAAGTLVPFMSELALPGDTFDIDLNCDILTHPTTGPLFGSYKVQLDIFQVPIRLYNGKLHMNLLGVGMEMAKVSLPQIDIEGNKIDQTRPVDNQQINPSSIFSYLGIRGLGYVDVVDWPTVHRLFNAVPYLGYWDIYKNYYANKQEEIGAVIHKDTTPVPVVITLANIHEVNGHATLPLVINDIAPPYVWTQVQMNVDTRLVITATGLTSEVDGTEIFLRLTGNPASGDGGLFDLAYLFTTIEVIVETGTVVATGPKGALLTNPTYIGSVNFDGAAHNITDSIPQVVTFPLENIDTMRKDLLKWSDDTQFILNRLTAAPYGLALAQHTVVGPPDKITFSATFSQEGLALKTYNSDLFNNWMSTEWIDGPDGISAVTAIDTSDGNFTIDELNLSKKIYDMLNRIAISGGSYDDWLSAVYTHDRHRSAENPMYLGGLIQNLVFQEVVSNAATEAQPLGTLAGRGTIGQKRKGGKVVAKIDEPSYLMGIISLTPNIDYSQGNKWDTNLRNMNDFHKPALDEIGFQDLVTDQMAWWDTQIDAATKLPYYKSAGKQPAWINYMTNVNVVKGNFADQDQQMFMVLNRRYGITYDTATAASMSDLTTYIDPTKFNHIFADTRRDAQNFWAQIGVNIEARRKMSAKVIPNL